MLSLLPCTQKDTDSNSLPNYLGQNIFSLFAILFCGFASLYSFFGGHDGIVVGEDIGGQMIIPSMDRREGALSKLSLRPDPNDLSGNSIIWNLRPPGAALLPVPGMLIGLSLGSFRLK